MSAKQLCVWDFTAFDDQIDFEQLKAVLREECRAWTFQKEETKDGKNHWQGRMSFKVAKRKPEAIKIFAGHGYPGVHVSATSNANKNNMFYVMKAESRIEGPWSDKDIYVPKQIRDVTHLRLWQKHLKNYLKAWDDRYINVIVQVKGNVGKSTIFAWLECYKFGVEIPPLNKCQDLMQAVCCIVKASGCENAPKAFFIDFPRAIKQQDQNGLFAAIEKIKGGWAYDVRYTYTSLRFDAPQVWVCMNTYPEPEMLSMDRWRFWKITEEGLVRQTTPPRKKRKTTSSKEAGQGAAL